MPEISKMNTKKLQNFSLEWFNEEDNNYHNYTELMKIESSCLSDLCISKIN